MDKTLIIIPNFNKLNLLKNCLNSLYENDSQYFDILVVDNASTDGAIEFLVDEKKTHSNLHYILLSHNEGFAKASNKGLMFSIDKKYSYSILLNNDTEVESDFVINLITAIKKHKNIFSVSSLMLEYNNRNVCDDCGDGYSVIGYQFQINKGLSKKEAYSSEVFSSCGGASIFNNKILQEIGLFDELHFAYLEDIDLGYRAKLYGYNNYFNKNAICYHIGSATTGSKYNELKVKLSARNSILVIYKNMHPILILINLFPLILGFMLKQFYFIKIGFGIEYFLGIIDGFKHCKISKKVDFNKISFMNIIKNEIDLIYWTIIYIVQFSKRKIFN